MKRLIKLMSIALCMMLVLSISLAGVFALSMNGVSLKTAAASDEKSDDSADTEAPLFKDESVYVIADASGGVEKIIVSDWIRNNAHSDTITDFSTLGNIENVKGDDTFTLDADNMRIWDVGGKDLYIKGESNEALPVDISLTYFLDGAIIDPADLIGKSGDVTIRFDYTNNQYETVEIDGEKERIYVPFMMMTGMILDGEKFTDVTVTNGKIISDGDRTIIAGIAFPGLQQSLDLKKKDIELPGYFEVKAHVEDFELNSTVTIATNGLFNQIDTKDLDKLDDIKKDMTKLEDAMDALIDGSSQLYDGLTTLLESSSELTEGIDQLYAGAQELADGAIELDDGAGTLADGAKQLSDGTGKLYDGIVQVDAGTVNLDTGTIQLDLGAGQLSGGLNTLTLNNDALTQGSDQTFSSILATARKALVEQGLNVPELTAANYARILEGLMDDLSEDNVKAQATAAAREKVAAAVEAQRDTVEGLVAAQVRQNVQSEVTDAVRAQVTQAVLTSLGYTVDEYNAALDAGLVDSTTKAAVNAAVEAQMASDDVQTTVSNLTEQNMQSDTVQAAIAQNTQAQIDAAIEQNMQSDEVKQAISDAVAQAKAGVQSIRQLKTQLDSYNQFNIGLKAYTSGVASASDGAAELKSGTSQLKSGTTQLKSGTSSLKSGASELKSGASELSDGADTLKSGTSQLAEGCEELLSGILTLKNGVPQLIEGVTQLTDGSMQLTEGLEEFNEEGISKIVSLMDDDLGKFATRLKALVDVSKDYKSFTGLTDDMDGEVKFIYKTADLSKDE